MERKLIFLNVLFLATCSFVWGFNHTAPLTTKAPLEQYLAAIDGYSIIRHNQLGPNEFNMLKLDDYVFTDYHGPAGKVNLYIGYYHSANKAYAAHSPLVCYPSQGWEITRQPVKNNFSVGPHRIRYEEIVTSSGRVQELVLYWYQAHLQTNTSIYLNKILMAYNRIRFQDDSHAFVRVSIPMEALTYDEAKERILAFIDAFYPEFVRYVSDA